MDSFTAETSAAPMLPPVKSKRKCKNVPKIPVKINPMLCHVPMLCFMKPHPFGTVYVPKG